MAISDYRIRWAVSIVVIAGMGVIAYVFLKDEQSVGVSSSQKQKLEQVDSIKCDCNQQAELQKILDLYSIRMEKTEAGEPIYIVDEEIYLGWRTYQTFCHACHGTDASGQHAETSPRTVPFANRLAPPLLNTVCSGEKEFVQKVTQGGGGMPSWSLNPLVITRAEHIFLYVAALKLKLLEYAEPRDRHLRLSIANPAEHDMDIKK